MSSSGNAKSPLTFGSYGNGATAIINGRGSPSAVVVSGQNHVTIQHLELDNGKYADVVFSGHSSSFTLSQCILKNAGAAYWIASPGYRQGAAVLVNNASGGIISGNTISHSYRGIELSGYGPVVTDSVQVTGNQVSYSGQTGINLTDGVTNSTVEGNEVTYSAQSYDDTAGIYTAVSGAGNIIRYNQILNGGTASTRSAGIMIDQKSAATSIYGNVIAFNTNGCIDEGSGSPSVVYNNTCYYNNQQSFDTGELNTFSSGAGVIFMNNIAVGNPGKHIVESSPYNTFDYNLYYGGSATPFSWGGISYSYNFANWQANSSQDAHSPSPSNPLFVNVSTGNFTLQPNSPAIGRGTNLGSSYHLAFDPSTSFPWGLTAECPTWNIGAFAQKNCDAGSVGILFH